MGTIDALGETTFGEAQVVQPTASGTSINPYTTYLVQAKLGDDNYTSRKRFSDFEWLRSAIVACFPGVRVPPLPEKGSTAKGLLAKTGRSEEAFIEARRSGLETFLQSLLRRQQLCVDSQILKRFLATDSEEAFEELKTKIDGVSVASKSLKYQQIFAAFKDATLPADDGIMRTKVFLTAHIRQLREIVDGFKEVVSAQRAFTRALSGAQTKVAAMSQHEASTLAGAGVASEARAELVAGLRRQSDAMQAAPASHYDVLLAAMRRELSEAEAMQEACDSLEVLQKDLEATKARVESLGSIVAGVLKGGEIPSTGTGVARMLGMAKPKSREEKISEMQAEHEQKQKDAVAYEEWLAAAHNVLVCCEIDAYFREKVARQQQTKDSFSGLSQAMAERLMAAWTASGPLDGPGGGYPSAVNDIPDEDYE